MLIRYRFYTRAIDDCRPLKDLAEINMPWWCTGYGDDYAIIVCYLPEEINLFDYWDDAFDISKTESKEVKYTSRFPKPSYIKDDGVLKVEKTSSTDAVEDVYD